MSRLTIQDLPLAGLKRIERQRLRDERGFFARLFCREELAQAGWTQPVVQINHSYTAQRGTVRGLHYQRPPHTEMKLVTCIRGEVWDVAVDLRADSTTFLQWHAQQLSADNGCALLIPPGFAHGFQALTDDVELIYCHSAAYCPQAEAGLLPTDPRLAISWPLPIGMISERDAGFPAMDAMFQGVRL